MKAIVTIAILYEVLHPKLVFSKYLNCVSLCLSERHVLVYDIFSTAPAAWNTRKHLVLQHLKANTFCVFCVYRDNPLSPHAHPPKTPRNPKSRHVRLLEFLIFPL